MLSTEIGRRRNGLKPSCEPCRRSKQACDHVQPTCGRCMKRGTPERCIFVSAPMATVSGKTGTQDPYRITKSPTPKLHSSPRPHPLPSPAASDDSIARLKARKDLYPDPGYLGSTSSNAVLQEIQGEICIHDGIMDKVLSKDEQARAELLNKRDSTKIRAGVELLTLFCGLNDSILIDVLAKKSKDKSCGLSMVSPILLQCIDCAQNFAVKLKKSPQVNVDLQVLSERMLQNTIEPIKLNGETSFEEYTAMFTGDNFRWEALGIVFAYIGLSTIHMHPTDSLFRSQGQKQKVCKEALDAAEACLACCDADQLNDLRLGLLFEIMMLTSLYHGDSSFHTWSRIGDLSSEVFALGLHQEIRPGPDVPFFLAEMRKRLFAMIYYQDKMLATFTGRPCRISRKFCVLQLPLDIPSGCLGFPKDQLQPYLDALDDQGWATSDVSSMPRDWYIRTCTLTGTMREKILELVLGSENDNLRVELENVKKATLDLWNNLPETYRYDKLAHWLDEGRPIKRKPGDLIGPYLDHLFSLFLIERTAVRRLKTSSQPLVNIAHDMLKIVLQAINLRGESALPAGDLAWHVSAYGLPSAGIIAMELLKHVRDPVGLPASNVPRSEAIQNLSVLVSQLSIIIPPGEGNYALFQQARKMLQAILDTILSPPPRPIATVPNPTPVGQPYNDPLADGLGNDWSWFDQFDFNGEFWNSVADHPLLAPIEPTVPS